MPNTKKVNETNMVDYIIEFEDGELSTEDVLELFAHLIETGTCWNLQGTYGRTAEALIDKGLISEHGVIDWDVYEELIGQHQ